MAKLFAKTATVFAAESVSLYGNEVNTWIPTRERDRHGNIGSEAPGAAPDEVGRTALYGLYGSEEGVRHAGPDAGVANLERVWCWREAFAYNIHDLGK